MRLIAILRRGSGPRRVLIGWDCGTHGIWWVLSKEEMEAPAPPGRWSGTPPATGGSNHRQVSPIVGE